MIFLLDENKTVKVLDFGITMFIVNFTDNVDDVSFICTSHQIMVYIKIEKNC